MSKGLNTNFSLSSSGAFVLSEGAKKAYNRLWFLSNFDKLRIYLPGYNPGFYQLVQKNAGFLVQFRQVILGRYQQLINTYVEEISVIDMNIVQSKRNRTEYGIYTSYKYLQSGNATAIITFLS